MPGAGRRPFRDGLVTSFANPKLAIFFVALFPQFVGDRGSVLPTTLLMVALASSFAWVAPTPLEILVFAAVGASSVVSQFCVVRALKLADASVVVPYQYTLIVWAVVFGWSMFGELPDASTVTGAAFIVAAGLYIFWREKLTHTPSPRPEAP